ncbi:PKD domain-containing protein [Candidatus Bipolaricaulota bacterium]|nr:PKD domain-containing protein [Candidatus Bipolaricaulota bacterium]
MKIRTFATILVMALLAVSLSGSIETVGPLARFTATPSFDYPPLETVFDASASSSPDGAIVSYEWDFGDGQTGVGAVVSHTFTDKGVYEVTLVVTDSAGKTGARIEIVEALNRIPTAQFDTSSYYIGATQPLRLDASDSSDPDGEIVQYLWSFGDGSTDEGMVVEHAFPYSPSGGGWTATVTLTVIDENGGIGTTKRPVTIVGCSSCSG